MASCPPAVVFVGTKNTARRGPALSGWHFLPRRPGTFARWKNALRLDKPAAPWWGVRGGGVPTPPVSPLHKTAGEGATEVALRAAPLAFFVVGRLFTACHGGGAGRVCGMVFVVGVWVGKVKERAAWRSCLEREKTKEKKAVADRGA
jgi:hypothetical protein